MRRFRFGPPPAGTGRPGVGLGLPASGSYASMVLGLTAAALVLGGLIAWKVSRASRQSCSRQQTRPAPNRWSRLSKEVVSKAAAPAPRDLPASQELGAGTRSRPDRGGPAQARACVLSPKRRPGDRAGEGGEACGRPICPEESTVHAVTARWCRAIPSRSRCPPPARFALRLRGLDDPEIQQYRLVARPTETRPRRCAGTIIRDPAQGGREGVGPESRAGAGAVLDRRMAGFDFRWAAHTIPASLAEPAKVLRDCVRWRSAAARILLNVVLRPVLVDPHESSRCKDGAQGRFPGCIGDWERPSRNLILSFRPGQDRAASGKTCRIRFLQTAGNSRLSVARGEGAPPSPPISAGRAADPFRSHCSSRVRHSASELGAVGSRRSKREASELRFTVRLSDCGSRIVFCRMVDDRPGRDRG